MSVTKQVVPSFLACVSGLSEESGFEPKSFVDLLLLSLSVRYRPRMFHLLGTHPSGMHGPDFFDLILFGTAGPFIRQSGSAAPSAKYLVTFKDNKELKFISVVF